MEKKSSKVTSRKKANEVLVWVPKPSGEIEAKAKAKAKARENPNRKAKGSQRDEANEKFQLVICYSMIRSRRSGEEASRNSREAEERKV